ncbi:MAG: MogA/MoaB family molybdenum cofactor biosynthesis protein [Thermoanaerobaculia bacterium]|nr:MogA/MoaB family molybdenum cofactor biosynthesis protein [Thermoanaerobaculia bacterium]
MSKATDEHREAAAGRTAACGVLTVSDSRTPETDRGGDLLVELLVAAGHTVAAREWVADDPMAVGRVIGEWIRDEGVEVVLTTGGTGLSSRDGTVEVVLRYLDKRIDGFGELFRMLSFEEIGPAAMLSRAVAGLAHETLLFALPGSPAAIRLALDRLILPELPHLLFERSR